MAPRRLGRALAAVAFAGPIAYAALITALGFTWAGYVPVRDSMSVLGAVDSPVRHVTNVGGFAGLGVVLLCFAGAYAWAVGRRTMAAVAVVFIALAGVFMIAVAFFPCDSGCIDVTATGRWHSYTSTPPAILLPLAAMASGGVFWARPDLFTRRWATASFWLGFASLMTGPALWLAATQPMLGLLQRVGIGLALVWVSGTGWMLYSRAGRALESTKAGPTNGPAPTHHVLPQLDSNQQPAD
ncbi:MAG: hypothetical protein CVT64_05210 [Actinobacteria bacterium HGW-Actinobacteria-4]|nr:MAG: hypothetical protein CVT64_05210 [Actinobacteria bacterium HGW-Actinobacteria-4]